MSRIHPLTWIALGIALLSLWVTLGVRMIDREAERLRRVLAQRNQLQDILRTMEEVTSSLHGQLDRPAVPIPSLCAVYLPGADLQSEPPEVSRVAGGLRHQIVQVRFRALGWDDLRSFIEKAESQSPPWRITALDIRASLKNLEGSLRLEALDKAPTSP